MNAYRWAQVLVLGSVLGGTFACSKADNDKKDAAPAPVASVGKDPALNASPGDTALGAVPCEESWRTYVQGHPQGLALSYLTLKQSTGADGTTIESSSSTSEDLVMISNDDQVVTQRTTYIEGLSSPQIASANVKKSDWVKGCNQLATYLSKIALGGKFEINEKTLQTIDVPAGTFNTEHLSGRTTGVLTSGTTVFQLWNMDDGSGIPVKVLVEATSKVGDADLVTTNNTELTKVVRP